MRRLRGSEIELEWHNSVRFGSSRVQHYSIIPNSHTHTHTHTSVRPSVCLCARFFTRKGRRLLIKTRAPPIIAGHYTFARCGHPARRIISHPHITLWEAHTCRHTHTQYTHRAVYWIVIIDTARKSWLISRGIYHESYRSRGGGEYIHAHIL